jgi:hypothetical protein
LLLFGILSSLLRGSEVTLVMVSASEMAELSE